MQPWAVMLLGNFFQSKCPRKGFFRGRGICPVACLGVCLRDICRAYFFTGEIFKWGISGYISKCADPYAGLQASTCSKCDLDHRGKHTDRLTALNGYIP